MPPPKLPQAQVSPEPAGSRGGHLPHSGVLLCGFVLAPSPTPSRVSECSHSCSLSRTVQSQWVTSPPMSSFPAALTAGLLLLAVISLALPWQGGNVPTLRWGQWDSHGVPDRPALN